MQCNYIHIHPSIHLAGQPPLLPYYRFFTLSLSLSALSLVLRVCNCEDGLLGGGRNLGIVEGGLAGRIKGSR